MAVEESASERGFARGHDLGEAIILDNWDRQVHLMSRKTREHALLRDEHGPGVAQAYHGGFVNGLLRSAVSVAEALGHGDKAEFENKVQHWISTLRTKTDEAKQAATARVVAISRFSKKNDWLSATPIMEQVRQDLETRFLGVHGAQYKHAFHKTVEEMEFPEKARQVLLDRGMPILPPEIQYQNQR